MAMSKQQFDAFFSKMIESPALKQKVMDLRGNTEEVYYAMVALAKDEGYEIDEADFREAYMSEGSMEADALNNFLDSNGGCGGNPGCTSVCTDICGMHLGHYVGKQ